MRLEEVLDVYWYAIHTKPNQENRASDNLRAWGVETFAPRLRKPHFNQSVAGTIHSVEPLFRGYIFARFSAERMMHKVRLTRGVHSVVSCGAEPTRIDDEIISLIQSRVEEGFVRMGEDLKSGDTVVIRDGPLQGFSGIFEWDLKDSDRVMILLTTISFQAHMVVERERLKKVGSEISGRLSPPTRAQRGFVV
jgi:transcriptional antiterminator RfaH